MSLISDGISVVVYLYKKIFSDRNDQPSSCCVRAVQELSHLTSTEVFMNSVKLKISDISYVQMLDRKKKLEDSMNVYECIDCPQFKDHVSLNKCFVWLLVEL